MCTDAHDLHLQQANIVHVLLKGCVGMSQSIDELGHDDCAEREYYYGGDKDALGRLLDDVVDLGTHAQKSLQAQQVYRRPMFLRCPNPVLY